MRILFAVFRVIAGGGIIAGAVTQLVTSIGFWQHSGITDLTVSITNFFSFFTIDSNLFAAIIMLIGAVMLVVRTGDDPRWFTLVRGSVVSYMVVTGIVYNVLLRGIELPQGTTVGWSNEVLHVAGPIYLLLDWLLAPGRTALPMRALWKMLAFPIVWVVYTMVRGPLVVDAVRHQPFWYPYPFLNPNNSPEGYVSVAFYIVLIAAVIGLVAAGVIWLSGRALPGRGLPAADAVQRR